MKNKLCYEHNGKLSSITSLLIQAFLNTVNKLLVRKLRPRDSVSIFNIALGSGSAFAQACPSFLLNVKTNRIKWQDLYWC